MTAHTETPGRSATHTTTKGEATCFQDHQWTKRRLTHCALRRRRMPFKTRKSTTSSASSTTLQSASKVASILPVKSHIGCLASGLSARNRWTDRRIWVVVSVTQLMGFILSACGCQTLKPASNNSTAFNRTPGRSGISAQFLSLPLGGNFPGAAVPGLSKPCSVEGTAVTPMLNARGSAAFFGFPQPSAGCASTSSPGALWAGGMASASALNPFTAASAVQSPQAPHESTWSLSNRMHTASGAVRSKQPTGAV